MADLIDSITKILPTPLLSVATEKLLDCMEEFPPKEIAEGVVKILWGLEHMPIEVRVSLYMLICTTEQDVPFSKHGFNHGEKSVTKALNISLEEVEKARNSLLFLIEEESMTTTINKFETFIVDPEFSLTQKAVTLASLLTNGVRSNLKTLIKGE